MSRQPKKISTLLRDAAKWIEENGWTQGQFFKYRNGKVVARGNDEPWPDYLARVTEKGCKACARGALYVADRPGLDDAERERRHEYALSYVLDEVGITPVFWNDNPERTKDEVVTALKDAAKAARKDGK